MNRYVSLLFLGVLLVYVTAGCAPRLDGPTRPSGYFFSVIVSDPRIYLMVNRLFENLPDAAQIIVRVRNAQGQPINGVPVTFQVEPDWAQNASLTPSHAVTQDGEAHAVFRANTIGTVRIIVKVEDMTRETRIVVSPAPDAPQGM